MSTTFNNPAEYPEGGEGTGGGSGRIPGRPGHPGEGGPSEISPFRATSSVAQLVTELLALNARVQGVETELLSFRLGSKPIHVTHWPGGGGPQEYPQFLELQTRRFGGPQELEMEGGEGTGGGTIGRFPQHEINELKATGASRVLQSISLINERLAALEARVTEVLQKISER
jgi:hypothetical protein